jgi:di-N-acetylchitobiase
MIRGIQRYLQLGIEAQKLILGVPWYGYRYPCLKGTKGNAEFCRIKEVPFRGVNCTDAAGIEVPFSTILSVLQNMTAKEDHLTGGIRRDEYMNAAFMNHVSKNGTVYQYWFDDDKSIRDKFAWAKSVGLGGVGPYTFDDLNPIQFPDESKAMWSAFDAFRDVGESMKLKMA